MKYRKLGDTGLTVSEIGMGTNTVSGEGSYGYNEKAEGLAALRRAYELGVTFFDTAEGYAEGRSEEALGEALGDKQDVIICTKVGGGAALTPERIRPACEASLRRLQRDTIDVYLLHNPKAEQIRNPAFKREMEALQRDGLIRTYGVSATTVVMVEDGHLTIDQGGYSSVELEMNIVFPEARETFLPRAEVEGVGVIIRVPLAAGLLTGKYTRDARWGATDSRTIRIDPKRLDRVFDRLDALKQLASTEHVDLVHLALAWVLSHSGVSTVIPGCKNVAQVEANVAASDVSISPEAFERALALA